MSAQHRIKREPTPLDAMLPGANYIRRLIADLPRAGAPTPDDRFVCCECGRDHPNHALGRTMGFRKSLKVCHACVRKGRREKARNTGSVARKYRAGRLPWFTKL